MSKPINVLILGAGSVGGYFGSLMYERLPGLHVEFIARGEHLKSIKDNGLRVETGNRQIIVPVDRFFDDTEEITTPDIILVCTKSFDAVPALESIRHKILENTFIIPLCNGLEATEKIRDFFPDNIVTHGCAYINSRITAPGKITNLGKLQRICFGIDWIKLDLLKEFEDQLKLAGIETDCPDHITPVIWEKFAFYFSCRLCLNLPQLHPR